MTTDRFTLDTNILIYVHDIADPTRRQLASQLVRDAAHEDCVLTLQSIGECFNALRRKMRDTPANAMARALAYANTFALIEPTRTAMHTALAAAGSGRFSYWDAFLLATAAESGCSICLSEDMHDGAKLGSITVRRPFDGDRLSKAAQTLLGP